MSSRNKKLKAPASKVLAHRTHACTNKIVWCTQQRIMRSVMYNLFQNWPFLRKSVTLIWVLCTICDTFDWYEPKLDMVNFKKSFNIKSHQNPFNSFRDEIWGQMDEQIYTYDFLDMHFVHAFWTKKIHRKNKLA